MAVFRRRNRSTRLRCMCKLTSRKLHRLEGDGPEIQKSRRLVSSGTNTAHACTHCALPSFAFALAAAGKEAVLSPSQRRDEAGPYRIVPAVIPASLAAASTHEERCIVFRPRIRHFDKEAHLVLLLVFQISNRPSGLANQPADCSSIDWAEGGSTVVKARRDDSRRTIRFEKLFGIHPPCVGVLLLDEGSLLPFAAQFHLLRVSLQKTAVTCSLFFVAIRA